MFTYFDVGLVGHWVQKSTICLAIKFKPKRMVRDWAKSKQLMFGNLVRACFAETT
jgi:hypothetical protein